MSAGRVVWACLGLAGGSALTILLTLLKGDGPGSGHPVLTLTPGVGLNSGDVPVLVAAALLTVALAVAGVTRGWLQAGGFVVAGVGVGGLSTWLALGTGPGSREVAWAPGATFGLSAADWPVWTIGAIGVLACGVGAAQPLVRS